MREIKFRAWLKDEKKMVEVKEISFITNEIMYVVEGISKDGDFEKNLDYLRKQTMYRFVYEKLELEKWFSNNESENNTFITLNMCLPLDFYDELVVSLTKKFLNVWQEQMLLAKLLSDEELFKTIKENFMEK